jgi:hypothetical protein
MSISSLTSALTVAFSALATDRRRRPADDVPSNPIERPLFGSTLDLDQHMLHDIGLGNGVYRRRRDDWFD